MITDHEDYFVWYAQWLNDNGAGENKRQNIRMVKCKEEDWAKFNNPADQEAVRIKSMKESGSMY